MMANYTISDYLLDRLAELGVDQVFGVPGDFTLALLDHVSAHPQLSWVGCTNELNAGYAADGYARMRGVGALMTTFGVGELSAINAVTGSFAEHVPVVHVVGSPSTGAQTAQRIVHHSLGDGVFTHFLQMHQSITCARAALSADNATQEIDRVLVAVRDRRLPGYLLLPTDVGESPAQPPAQPLPAPHDPTDPAALAAFGDAAGRLISGAADTSEVSVLAGLLVHRFGAAAELGELLRLGTPHATSAWSKSLVDETNPAFLGLYAGGVSTAQVRASIEDAPVLIVAGVQFTDLNSGFFTHQIPRERTIELGADTVSVGEATFGPITIGAALRELTGLVSALPPSARPAASALAEASLPQPDEALSQASLWTQIAGFLRPGDVVLADQGTSFYGMATQRLPSAVTFIGQPLWASIGYSIPALLGAMLAVPARRGILLVGDGAAQMTVQELSTVLRLGLPAIVVVVDNDGYTVERAIHGATAQYNDIAAWDWTALPALFAPHRPVTATRVSTTEQLAHALANASSADQFTLIQAVVPRMDVPDLLAGLARAAATANAPAQTPNSATAPGPDR
jgi:TPP-dependent 2-oxoacid decarboxylase